MALLSWRTFVLSFVTTLSILAGCSNSLQACCLSWIGSCFSGCGCDGTYSSSYGAYYGGGYSGGYYGGYAPTYDRCGGCGYGGGSYGYNYSGSTYAGGGCSSCADGGCGVSLPSSTAPLAPTADPADPFKAGRGSRGGTDDPAKDAGGTRRHRNTNPEGTFGTPPAARNPSRRPPSTSTESDPRNEGYPSRRGRTTEPESSPSTDDPDFHRPLSPKTGTEGAKDPFKTEKPPMPEDTEKPKTPQESEDPNAFPEDPNAFPSEDAETKPMRTNRPVLGTPSETDDASSSETVIPHKTPAPIEFPTDPEPEEPADVEELNLDDAISTSAVSPKTRLVLQGRFNTPSVARIRLRPNHTWVAEPEAQKLAKH